MKSVKNIISSREELRDNTMKKLENVFGNRVDKKIRDVTSSQGVISIKFIQHRIYHQALRDLY